MKATDFTILFHGYGHFKVSYTSPITGKSWTTVTNDTQLIDAIKHNDNPKKKDLKALKSICKNF
jgi:hypothetical protein